VTRAPTSASVRQLLKSVNGNDPPMAGRSEG
jgi:hypothetical protein